MRDEYAARGAGRGTERAPRRGDDAIGWARGEQTLVLLNRRGFATVVFCRQCGASLECPHCSVSLTFHKAQRRVRCHYCNYAAAVPRRCGACGGEYLEQAGFGTERLEADLRAAVPGRAHHAGRPRHDSAPRRHHARPAGGRAGRHRHPGRHPDDRQGPRLSRGDAGRRRVCGRRAGAGRLPRGRTHVPASDAGRRPRGARRNAGRGHRPDALSGPLRHPGRRRAGLRDVLPARNGIPRQPALSADRRDDQRHRQGPDPTQGRWRTRSTW